MSTYTWCNEAQTYVMQEPPAEEFCLALPGILRHCSSNTDHDRVVEHKPICRAYLAPVAPDFAFERSVSSPADFSPNKVNFFEEEKQVSQRTCTTVASSSQLGRDVSATPSDVETSNQSYVGDASNYDFGNQFDTSTQLVRDPSFYNFGNNFDLELSLPPLPEFPPPASEFFPSEQSQEAEPLEEEHVLAKKWCYWEKTKPKSDFYSEIGYMNMNQMDEGDDEYQKSHRIMKQFNTIEGFMALHNGIPAPSFIINKSHIVRTKSIKAFNEDFKFSEEYGPELSAEMSPTVLGKSKRLSRRSILGNFPAEEDNWATTTIEQLLFFEKGVKPFWEDPAHKEGGVMQFTFKTDFPGPAMNEIWERMIFSVLGGCVPHAEKVTGVRLADRLPVLVSDQPVPAIRVEVWHRHMDQGAIKELLDACLELIQDDLEYGGNATSGKVMCSRGGTTNLVRANVTYNNGYYFENPNTFLQSSAEYRRGSV